MEIDDFSCLRLRRMEMFVVIKLTFIRQVYEMETDSLRKIEGAEGSIRKMSVMSALLVCTSSG